MKRGYNKKEPLYKRLLSFPYILYIAMNSVMSVLHGSLCDTVQFAEFTNRSTVSFSDSAKRITGFNTMINRSSLHIIHCIRVFS